MSAIASADHQAILDRIHRYAWASDERKFDALASCFTVDAVHRIEDSNGAPEVVRGSQAIARWVEERHAGAFASGARRRHMTCCTGIEPAGDGRALARSYFQVVAASPGSPPAVVAFGHYEDTLVQQLGNWLLCERVVRVEGRT